MLVALLGGWIFAPALTGEHSFAFRDAAHYYHPLFQWTRAEWAAGRAPLWNPLDNLGVSVVGESTTSVFYLGKLIFALPLEFTWAYNLYVVAHVALAAWGSYRLARCWGVSTYAAGLGAISYAFSGDVLFQVTNVVFLVGAAWLPWALASADRMLHEGRARSAVGLGVVLALMISGGDPQMAVNTVLLVGVHLVLTRWVAQTTRCLGLAGKRGPFVEGAVKQPALSPLVAAQPRQQVVGATRALGLLAFATVLSALLAAVQMIPSWQSTRESSRASYDEPRNLYELAACALERTEIPAESRWYDGLLSTDPQGHASQIYQFSVGPWRVIEYFWPNIAGRQFPTFHRWLDALPAEGRVWTQSLYLGVLPFVMALTTFSLRRSASAAVRFSSWMVVLGGFASLGIYGLAWLVRETALLIGLHPDLGAGDQVGGLYWLLTVVVPGYVYFRYPAKLMVIVALGLSMLAARGWDRSWQAKGNRVWLGFTLLTLVSIAGLAISWALWSRYDAARARIPPDPMFGLFDSLSAWHDLSTAFTHTAVGSALFAALFFRRSRAKVAVWAPASCLLLTALDLAIAQSPLISYAPASAWTRVPQALRALDKESRAQSPDEKALHTGATSATPADELRFYRDPRCANESWLTGSSFDRPAEGVLWESDTLASRYHLPYSVARTEAVETLAAADELAVWQCARDHADRQTGLPAPSVLDLMGARRALVPATIGSDELRVAADVAMQSRASALPRAWIVHDVIALPELRSRRRSAIAARTEEVLLPEGQSRDWLLTAVVETDEAVELPKNDRDQRDEHELCIVTYDGPQRVEVNATLARPGLVVLRDRFDSDWNLVVETAGTPRMLPVLHTNLLMRGVLLPAGNHRLIYRYRPRGFYVGAMVSLATVCAIGLVAAVTYMRRPVRRPE